MADWTPLFGGGDAIDPTEEEERRERRQHAREMKRLVGKRIRLRESPEVTAYWRAERPLEWHPEDGDTGTVIKVPVLIGEGPTVRWANGQVTTLGSMSRYDVL